MRHELERTLATAIGCLLGTAAPLWALGLEEATLARPEEPLELRGADLAQLDGQPLARLRLFAWGEGGWRAIPVQFDERGPSDSFFESDDRPDTLDGNDSIVFMQEDVGGRVDAGTWVDAADDHRYQIEVVDPRPGGGRGWVYLFAGEALPPAEDDYVEMVAFDPFEIETDRYLERFAAGNPGVLLDLVISEGFGGNGVDLFDRVKYRAKPGFLTPWLTEDDGWVDYGDREPIDGPVRVLNSFKVSLAGFIDMMDGTVFFYRQMVVVETVVYQIIWPDVRHMVWLADANPEVGDLIYYNNAGEQGIALIDTVDGDGLRSTDQPARFHEWRSPSAGGALTIQDPWEIPGDEHLSYYCDGCEETRWTETGDGVQWGQWGNWVKGLPFGAVIPTEIWNVWLPPGSESVGQDFSDRFMARSEALALWQERETTEVREDGERLPGLRVALHQNHPNPFNPSTTLRFDTPGGPLRLAIYDARGARARTLVEGEPAAGSHAATWDGRDDAGRLLPSGRYLAWLHCGGRVETASLVLVR